MNTTEIERKKMISGPYKIDTGYIVVQLPDLGGLLIDTGAGICVTTAGQNIRLLGTTYRTTDNYNGATIEGLREFVGPFDLLIGQEVLNQTYVYLDRQQMTATLTTVRPACREPSHVIRLRKAIVPQLKATVNNAPGSFVFDSGSPHEIVDAAYLNGKEPVDEVEDFYPGYGPFSMPVYEVPMELNGISIPAFRACVLPPDLPLHRRCGADGILGLSHLIKEGNVLLALPDSELIIEQNPEEHLTEKGSWRND